MPKVLCDASVEGATQLGKDSAPRQPSLKGATRTGGKPVFLLEERHMLPDFTRAKSRANRDLLRWVRKQIPAVTPLIQGMATSTKVLIASDASACTLFMPA